jgi:hypothetical protein
MIQYTLARLIPSSAATLIFFTDGLAMKALETPAKQPEKYFRQPGSASTCAVCVARLVLGAPVLLDALMGQRRHHFDGD